jgi:hypothetical protein
VTFSAATAAPLLPDPDDARELIERELRDPAYAEAEPTLFDRVARAVGDFLGSLLNPQVPDGWGPAVAVVATVVIVLIVVAAVLIWGRPRRIARSQGTRSDLFGTDDARSAVQLRADAAAAAGRGEWETAIADRFRAIARSLAERVLVESSPGTTAQAFARDTARVFPEERAPLHTAASVFDDVRYLRRPGTAELYRDVTSLDERLAAARPLPAQVPA